MELPDTVNLSRTGDHLGGADDQDTPPRLKRQLHRISFEADHPALPDGVKFFAFTGAENDGLPIDDEVHGQDHDVAVPPRPSDTANAHCCQQGETRIPVETVDDALLISRHPIVAESTVVLESTMPTGPTAHQLARSAETGSAARLPRAGLVQPMLRNTDICQDRR